MKSSVPARSRSGGGTALCNTLWACDRARLFPYQFTGTVAKQTQLCNLLRADGAPVLLEPVDPYEISRVSPWVRGNGNRVSVLLVNTGFDPALPFEVCIRGSWMQASLLLPTGERRPVAPVYDGSFTRVRVEGLAPWDFLAVLAGE
ncbi:MAG: hypothetical protein ACLSB9_25850 [Hydrogeniiclostridium mannosilyticum]